MPAEDFVSLPVGEGYARLGAGACALRVKFAPPIPRPDPAVGDRVRELSWKTYAAPPMPKEEAAPATVPTAVATELTTPAASAGRGSRQHKMLQRVAKQWGEESGFRATLEHDILGGAGRVDVVLERDGLRIAVEVCLTNSPTEVADAAGKCAAAGFDHVVMVATDQAVRSRIEKSVLASVPAGDHGKLHFVEPDALRTFLDGFDQPSEPEDRTVGYRVRVQTPTADRMRQRRALARLVGSALLDRRTS